MVEIEGMASWGDLVAGQLVATKKDEVAPHSSNPLGLQGRWVYAGGCYEGQVWTMLWLQLRPEWYANLDPHVCEGVGSVTVTRWPDGEWRFIGNSRASIGTGVHVRLAEPPPPQYHRFCKVRPLAKEAQPC